MKIIKNIEHVPAEEKISITIGNFDGVHLGHKDFLGKIKEDAIKIGAKFVVVTFTPHPIQILKAATGFLINTYLERRELLSSCGVDYLLEVDFTRDFSTLSPENFLSNYIFTNRKIQKIYLGHDFAFGANKKGDHILVKKICDEKKIDLSIQTEFTLDGKVLSSTVIRKCITEGDVELASRYLGRNYFISGRIIKGQGRGRQIGFPTANLGYDRDLILPSNGVYMTSTHIGNMKYQSITNIGHNPTFSDLEDTHIETNIFDFDRDIYGEEMRVYFLVKIRDEKKFLSVNELIEQIKNDVSVVKNKFKLK